MTYETELKDLGYQPHEIDYFTRFARGISNHSFYRDAADRFSPDSRIVVLKDTRFFVELFQGKQRLDPQITGEWVEISLRIAKLIFGNQTDFWLHGGLIDQFDIDLEQKKVTLLKRDGDSTELPVDGMTEIFQSLFSGISAAPEKPREEQQSSRPDAALHPLAERKLDISSEGPALVLMNRGTLKLSRGADSNKQLVISETERRRLAELKETVIRSQNVPCQDIDWDEELLYEGIALKKHTGSLFGHPQTLTMLEINQGENSNRTLTPLVSKVSEAIYPREPANHIGDGATIREVFAVQKHALVAVNLLFQHYMEDYYSWDGSAYHLGDPVGWNKIRRNIYGEKEEIEKRKDWGYLCQRKNGEPFEILPPSAKDRFLEYHYAVGCGPLICMDHRITPLEQIEAEPLAKGAICPPGDLGHLYDRAPRTIVGIKDDGALVFLTIDGRQKNAAGMNYAEMAGLIEKLGWKAALNLDGGGSTAIYDRRRGYLNQVSEKDAERKLCTLFLISDSTDYPTYRS